MKIIFLDIDGVLNSRQWMEEFHAQHPTEHRFMQERFDEKAVARLQRLVEATDAKIVISSTWRLLHSLSDIRGLLNQHGFKGDVIDKTPRIPDGVRGGEIETWLSQRNSFLGDVDSFVILDDDDDMEPLMDKLVQTNFEFGLQDEHVEKAIEMLNVACSSSCCSEGGKCCGGVCEELLDSIK